MCKPISSCFSNYGRRGLMLAGVFLFSACAQPPTAPPQATGSLSAARAEPVEVVFPQTSVAKVHSGALLLDVRSPEEFADGHISNALNVPHTEVSTVVPRVEPDKSREIVLYCASGRRAAFAQAQLKQIGYQRVSNAGSYTNLKAQEE